MRNLKMENQTENYTVLVNSCDAFEDCWNPFFTLFCKYWPDFSAPILLNTETKSWFFEGLDLKCTQVQLGDHKRLSWSDCLIKALDQVKTPLVLYFQEDYFIHQTVDSALIQKACEYMYEHPGVQRIALTRHSGPGPFEKGPEDWLKTVSRNARYRISTQACLWRVENLKSYLKNVENGWMFEIFGTWRSHKRNDLFLVASSTEEPIEPAIDYLHTGIIKGQWHSGMKNVFSENKINIDFQKRGFHVPQKGIKRKVAVIRKLSENRSHALKELYLRFGSFEFLSRE
ncbi:MAG: hypothetical protein EOO85_08980 [Pedobacter sp.]|nr:MAG: hypothetical protein EOO85_08980 [Pedobacter sp.]